MVRLFTVQLEHYEKIEGVPLSLDGKANQLAAMVRGNLGAALQGFVVVPLFAGYDTDATDPAAAGRIVTFDATGGRYEEKLGFHAVGSGSVFAAVPSRSCTTPQRPWTGRSAPRSSRSTTPPTTIPPPAGRTSSATSTRSWSRSPVTVPCATRTPTSARSPRPW